MTFNKQVEYRNLGIQQAAEKRKKTILKTGKENKNNNKTNRGEHKKKMGEKRSIKRKDQTKIRLINITKLSYPPPAHFRLPNNMTTQNHMF